MWLIVLATSEIKSNDPSLPAPSLLVGGFRVARSLVNHTALLSERQTEYGCPQLCGHSVEAISSSRAPQSVQASSRAHHKWQLTDLQALKAFWDLPESVVVGSLPKIVLPAVAVDSVFEIPPTREQSAVQVCQLTDKSGCS